MRLVKVLATVIFSIIIIIAICGYFFVRNFDLNKYKSYASQIVEEQLGRKLAINGDAYLGIALSPTVIVNNVELSNPDWAKNPQMLKIKQLEVKFALLPLLKKQVVIDKVALIDPEVFLETSKTGVNSWDFKTTPARNNVKQAAETAVQQNQATPSVDLSQVKEHPEMAALAGFAAKSVSIENGLLEYYNAAKNQSNNVKINSIQMSAPAMNEEMEASFDIVADQNKLKGDITLGSVQTLMEGKLPYPFTLTAKALGIDIEANGNVEDVMKSPRYAVQANIYNPAGNMNAPETTLKARIDGDVNAANADIQVLNIVNNLITGKASVNWSGKIPSIDANLRSDKINLQSFSQSSSFAYVLPSLIAEAQAAEMVPNTAIPYSALQSVNAKAELKVATLIIAPGMQASNVDMKANLQNGVLNVNPLTLKFGGGDIVSNMMVNANNQSIQLKLVSQNMLLQNLHKDFVADGKNKFGVLEGGNIDLNVNLAGNGSTYRQMVQTLQGSAIAIVDKSVIQAGELKFMSGNFISQLLTALNIDSSKASKLDLTCGVVRADLSGGKAVFPKGIAINSQQLTLVSDGNINLNNDKINFTVKPFSGKLVDTNVAQALSSFVKVGGTLESPKIMIDDKEALKAIVGVATTGGTAYLGSKLLLDADSSPCYTALQGTVYANRFPKPTGVQATGQEVYQGTVKDVDQGLKDLKNVAKDIFKGFKKL